MEITIINLQKKLLIHPERIKKLVHNILKSEKVRSSGAINICFVSNRLIRKFNAKYHKRNRPTDVLAFNLSDPKKKNVLLADIMVSSDAAIKAARSFKTASDYELSLYVAHGVLHLLGFNDRSKRQIQLIRKKENQYVNR